jgi:2-oxoglutarate dehydrogenase E1 component
MMFSVVDSGLVWGDPSLDLTPEINKRFDSASPAAAVAPRPAAAAPAAPRPAAPAAPAAPRPTNP